MCPDAFPDGDPVILCISFCAVCGYSLNIYFFFFCFLAGEVRTKRAAFLYV